MDNDRKKNDSQNAGLSRHVTKSYRPLEECSGRLEALLDNFPAV